MRCDRAFCKEHANWRPTLVVHFGLFDVTQVSLPLQVCDTHKERLTIKHFKTSKGWRRFEWELSFKRSIYTLAYDRISGGGPE